MQASHPVECVINVSEGRAGSVLDAITVAIDGVAGCRLLHRDRGAGAHRTVFTFAGEMEAVMEAAFRVYEVAHERIDMRRHRGSHPRSGAVDVCPFVALGDTDEAALRARTQVLAKRVAEAFDLPIYLYSTSAGVVERRELSAIRRGEYEGLQEKLALPGWRPDFGPARPHPRLGISVMGVRPFLIAWNMNLEAGASPQQARWLAGKLRGSGRDGIPGLFPDLRSIGWYIEEYGRCQVSCNVVDPDTTPLARVYLTACSLAAEAGFRVTGSELIGLVPARHLRAAARGFCWDEDYENEMNTAVDVLGLNDLQPFHWRRRVLEEVLAR
jgi:glutamate formiminotransferase/formiminotetrahydrofolate cyclodeaminase